MNALALSLLLTGLSQHTAAGDRLENANWKSLGYASIIYVSDGGKTGFKDADVIRYLSRHSVPAARVIAFHRAAPIVGADGKQANSKTVVLSTSSVPTSVSVSVFIIDPTRQVNL